MSWWGSSGRKGEAGSNNAEDESAAPPPADYVVPDVPRSSHAQQQQNNNNNNNSNHYQQQQQQRLVLPGSKQPDCWRHFRSELNPCQSWFHVQDTVNGRVLDIPESFAPASGYAFVWKVLYCTTCIGTMIYAMIDSGAPYFYFAYYTNWGVLWCSLYSLCSVINTVLASRTGQPAAGKSVGFRIRLTWVLLTIAAHGSATATVLFWPLVYDPKTTDLQYLTVAPHGVLLVLTLVDGFYVNRIPLRWMHYFGISLPLDLLFAIWSFIHSQLDIGNPNFNDTDPTTNDDALYVDVLEWNHDWQTALVWAVIAMLVVGPLLFALLWTVSTGGCCKDTRKYIDDVDPTDDRPTVYDVEEGSVFAKWR